MIKNIIYNSLAFLLPKSILNILGSLNSLESFRDWLFDRKKVLKPISFITWNNSDFYFVHNFAVKCNDDKLVLTTTNYDVEFVSAFQKDNIYAVQFHPEKSSASGLKIIQNFLEI